MCLWRCLWCASCSGPRTSSGHEVSGIRVRVSRGDGAFHRARGPPRRGAAVPRGRRLAPVRTQDRHPGDYPRRSRLGEPRRPDTVAGVGLLFVRKRSTAALDRLLLGERRDAAACLRAVDSVVAGGGDVASLADALLDGIVRSLGVDHGVMLLPDSSRDALVPTRGGFRPLALRSAIAEVLRAAGGPVDVDLLRRWNAVALLPTDERAVARGRGRDTPRRRSESRRGAPQAIAVLGPRRAACSTRALTSSSWPTSSLR